MKILLILLALFVFGGLLRFIAKVIAFLFLALAAFLIWGAYQLDLPIFRDLMFYIVLLAAVWIGVRVLIRPGGRRRF